MDLFASLQTLISEGLLFFSLDQPYWSKWEGSSFERLAKGREGKGSGVTMREIDFFLSYLYFDRKELGSFHE